MRLLTRTPKPSPVPAHEPTTPDRVYQKPKHVIPGVIWRVTTDGLIEDERPEEILAICREMKKRGLINNCLIRYKGSTSYIVMEDDEGNLSALPIPKPTEIKTTPSALYAKTVTYGKTWRRLLKRRLKQDKDPFNKASKMIWVGALIIVVVFVIFVLSVAIMGGNDTPVSGTQVEQYGSPADLTIPGADTSTDIPRGVKTP